MMKEDGSSWRHPGMLSRTGVIAWPACCGKSARIAPHRDRGIAPAIALAGFGNSEKATDGDARLAPIVETGTVFGEDSTWRSPDLAGWPKSPPRLHD